MTSLNTYFEKYHSILFSKDISSEDAYKEVEKWHIRREGSKKCQDYDTFRSLKSQWIKGKRGI